MRGICLVMLLSLIVAGCESPYDEAPPEAPPELDDLIHFFLQNIDGDDATLVGDGAQNLADWYEADSSVVDGLASGTVSAITGAELAQFEDMTWEPDPSLVTGVYSVKAIGCSFEQMIDVFLEPDQKGLFPATYTDYEREFDSDPDCFDDETCDQLDYHSTNTTELALSIEMTYDMHTRLKRFRYADAGAADTQVVLVRNVMPEPAVEDIEDAGYEQSYHIEAHLPWGSSQTLHLYGLWNYGYLEGIDEDVEFWGNEYLNGLLELDDDLEALCAEGAI
jgi:hypothetical protein